MVIDLARCKNVGKCQEACNHAHQVHPGQNWIKVLGMQDADHTAPYWQPTTCMHCDEPPCVKVCPVDATFKRQDGIVLIDSDRCIGCRFCMAACPYSTRVFNWEEPILTKKWLISIIPAKPVCRKKKERWANVISVPIWQEKVNCHIVYPLAPMEFSFLVI